MYDPDLRNLVEQAVTRLQRCIERQAPLMAPHLQPWLAQLAGTGRPVDYFTHPAAFPALLLPWWVEQAAGARPDLALQADLVYSTINGYYYIRLIDNLVDGNATVELGLLPALGLFHSRFQAAYQAHFAAAHPFWPFFHRTWLHSAAVTLADAHLVDIDEAHFKQISAQKTCAAKIPLAAACYRHNRPGLIEPWAGWVDLFGCWHQLLNDLFDWQRDYRRQTPTYFLAEAERQRRPGEPVAAWVVRSGFGWASEKLQTWMAQLKQQAALLGSRELAAYLDKREAMFLAQQEQVRAGLRSLAHLWGVVQNPEILDNPGGNGG